MHTLHIIKTIIYLLSPFNNFTLKNCLYGSSNIKKNINKSKRVDTGNGLAFDELGFMEFW